MIKTAKTVLRHLWIIPYWFRFNFVSPPEDEEIDATTDANGQEEGDEKYGGEDGDLVQGHLDDRQLRPAWSA